VGSVDYGKSVPAICYGYGRKQDTFVLSLE